ncbi:GSCFA domain-containing protein [Nisaea sp.]|uniref:GSCFA domain-containing protein n=1 Tax=Nisaea sp. TaxID=2024842 RepID=UPI002B265EA2|nr:GSCFA domain-containing protein [Nisaea sp.]
MLPRPHKYPQNIDDFSNFPKFIRTAFSDYAEKSEKIIRKDSKILAQGSCFAGNIIESLIKLGLTNCDHFDISENFNNTFANKAIIDLLTQETITDKNREWISKILRKNSFEEAKHKIQNAEIIILTFGVSIVLINPETGEIQNKPGKNSNGIMTTVSENAKNIESIINKIKKINTNCKIFITLSPIPLHATFLKKNVFVDDFLSKSTIRLAIEEAKNKFQNDVIYWPSFEIVRWSNIHFPPSFGGPNKYMSWPGHPRHPNPSIISETMKFFLDVYGDVTTSS